MGKAIHSAKMHNQSGAVLLVSLVMLLLLTIIGLSAVDITTLDTRISANSGDRNIAFYAAETALNVATDSIAPGKGLPEDSGQGYLSSALADNWWGSASAAWWSGQSQSITAYGGRSAKQNYVIEPPVQMNTNGAGQAVADLTLGSVRPVTRFYRVTARGEGPGGANVHIQTVYARKIYSNAVQ